MVASPRSSLASLAAILTALALGACAGSPDAAPPGDPVEGRKVAGELCASCHSVEAAGESPNPVAPPLRIVLASYDPERLAEDLENAVAIRHLEMPRFYFGGNHARDVVAYIETIQTAANR